jgi:hypothetical protein
VAPAAQPLVEASGAAVETVGGQGSGLSATVAELAQPLSEVAQPIGRSVEVPAGILGSLLASLEPAGGEGGPLLVSEFFPVVSSDSVTFESLLAAGSPVVPAGFAPFALFGQSELFEADSSLTMTSPGLFVALSAPSEPLPVDGVAVVNPLGASSLSVEAGSGSSGLLRFFDLSGLGVGSAAAWSAPAVSAGVVAALLGLLIVVVPGLWRRLCLLPGFLRPSVVVSLSGRPG